MAIDYDILLGNGDIIDALGSVVVNLNSTGSPYHQWLSTETVKGYGLPTNPMGSYIPHVDTVAYKIKSMDAIPEHDDPASTLGDSLCLTSPTTCSKRGPFFILGRKYYIDFMFMYFKNTGTETVYSPLYAVDGARCDAHYGYFIGSPSVAANTQATSTSLMTAAPKYTNDLGVLDTTVNYKFTTVDATDNTISANLDISSILTVVESTISNGQTTVVAEGSGGSALSLLPDQYHPIILFRYVSENSPTRPVNITFRYGVTVG